MRPCAYANQSLIDHIEGCLKSINKFLEKNPTYASVAARRLRVSSEGQINLEGSEIETIIRQAAIFHDIGKAYTYFQKNYDEKCQCKRKVGFQHHEILSAIICYNYGKRIGAPNGNEKKLFLVLSVLNHDHAFKDVLGDIVSTQPYTSTLLNDLARIAESQIYMSRDLEKLFENYNLPIEVVKVNREDIDGFHNWLNSYLKDLSTNRRQWTKLYVLIMNPLLVADNMDACEKRGNLQLNPSRKSFLNELKEAIE